MNILYCQGTKSAYRNATKSSNSLYFCTDSKELFKGEDLYTDGLRLVENYASLPDFSKAADGKLYVCEDTGCGYVLNSQANGWQIVLFGTDNQTIEANTSGLLAVKAIPISTVTGLEERLQTIEADVDVVATTETAGNVKASEEVLVAVDGTMSIGLISKDKIDGLNDTLDEIDQTLTNTTHYKGSVSKFSDLPTIANTGDIYYDTEKSTMWINNGTGWLSLIGEESEILTPIAKAEINTSQFEISNNTLNLVSVSADVVKYGEQTLSTTLDNVVQSITWSDFSSN